MVIIETSLFTRQVQELLSESDYGLLQVALMLRPDLGAIISGSGGLRKARWRRSGHGKRGGVRTIYYWAVSQEQILMLAMYAKNEQEDLTPSQLAILRRIVEEEYP